MDWKSALSETIRCLYCHSTFYEEASWSWALGFKREPVLCPPCGQKLEPIAAIGCDMCGRQPAATGKEEVFVSAGLQLSPRFTPGPKYLCRDCTQWNRGEERPLQHRALCTYNTFLQELIALYKYRGDTALSALFANDLKKLARSLKQIDAVTPVPLHADRLWERGFNQAALLASAFNSSDMLVRSTPSEKQSKRVRHERIRALKGVFALSEKGKAVNWHGKRILLVDDIYTTGATLRAAADVFYDRGAARVFAVTVARAKGQINE